MPDTINFIKAKAMIYSNELGTIGPTESSVCLIEGDINSMPMRMLLKVDQIKNCNYDEVYLFIVWESFQDIFGDEDIEFMPLVFGFSLVKLFNSSGAKSLSTAVGFGFTIQKWRLCEGHLQIGIF